MLLLSDIKGQGNAVRYLSNSLSSGRIANSYLFSGPEGVGRASIAKAFVMALICPNKTQANEACTQCSDCRRVDALQHPDLTWIKPRKNRNIRIEEVRKVRDILNLKPYESTVSVCVMEDAHMMTPSAANALLKVLEEPPGRSLLILITSKKELLLETVVSRCAEIRFGFLPIPETKDIITKKEGIDEEEAYFLAYFSQGSPGRALEMIGEGIRERKDDLITLVNEVAREKNASCLNWTREGKDQLLEDLEMLILFFRDIALQKEGLGDMVLDKELPATEMYRFFEKYSIEKIYNTLERLIKIKLALAGNINPKLVAQVLPGALKGEYNA